MCRKMENSKKCINCNQYFGTDQEKCSNCKLPLTPISNDLAQGEMIGEKYEIDSLVGDGGMSKVYRASHKLMKREVAIKMLHAGLVGQTSTLTRFKKEAEASSRLNHTNIVTTFDFGLTPDGRPYLVMDYLEGRSFSELLQEERLIAPERCLKLFIQLCAGLEHAHAKGIVHRDIKPSNIYLVQDEKGNEIVKLLDFGIAKRVSESKHNGNGKEESNEESNEVTLTEAGTVFGSPLYMSPEQVRGESVDFRSDIYSLSCLLYQSLTGTPIYDGEDAMDCMYQHVNDEPEPFNHRCSTADIPDSLQSIVFKGLDKDPENRIQSMEDYRVLLEAELLKLEQSENAPADSENPDKPDNQEESEVSESQPQEDESENSTVEDTQTKVFGRLFERIKSVDPLSYLVPLGVVLLLALVTQFTDTKLYSGEGSEANRPTLKKKKTQEKREEKNEKIKDKKNNSASSDDDSDNVDKRGPLQIPEPQKSSTKLEVDGLLEKGKASFRDGDYGEAQNRFIEALELAKEEGANSLHYLESASWIGKTLLKRKKYRLAAGYLEWSAEKFETRYGTGSRFAKEARTDLAACRQALALKN